MQVTELLKLGAQCLDNLAMLEVEVDEHAGRQDLAPILAEFGKSAIHPKLDPSENDFTSETSFWLLASKRGVRFACVGARLEDLGTENVADYWARTTRKNYPNAGDVIYDHLDPNVSLISGKMAYLGDMFVKESSRGSPTFLTNFMMLMHLLVRVKWEVNYSYSFLRYVDIKKAKSHLYHYPTSIRDYQRWKNPPYGRASSEYLLTMSRPQFEHISRSFLDDPNGLIFER